jgi:hypothetical protein
VVRALIKGCEAGEIGRGVVRFLNDQANKSAEEDDGDNDVLQIPQLIQNGATTAHRELAS